MTSTSPNLFDLAGQEPSSPTLPTATIWADGACSGNPGPGGWGTIVEVAGERREFSGGAQSTTNNQMEMTALIEGLRQLEPRQQVLIVMDSEYVIKGLTQWMPGWIRNGWRTASKKPVKNRELWEELHRLTRDRVVKVQWVRGHDGHVENERCDLLARLAIPVE